MGSFLTCLCPTKLLFHIHSNLNPFDESRLFVIPAEGTDSIDDLIDLLQRFPMHESVEFIEVGFDGCVIDAPDSL